MKSKLQFKSFYNIILGLLFFTLLFVPSAKAMLIRGLMEVGFFKPTTTPLEQQSGLPTDLSGIRFTDVSGKTINLEQLKGKVVFLNFWAVWCPPCLAEMPAINKLYVKFKDNPDYVFIFVDADSDLVKAQKFMDRRKYLLPVYEVASDLPAALFNGTLPTTVVFDKEGRVSYNESGAADYSAANFTNFMIKLSHTN